MKYLRTENKLYEVIEETDNSFELRSAFDKMMSCSCIMLKRQFGSNENQHIDLLTPSKNCVMSLSFTTSIKENGCTLLI